MCRKFFTVNAHSIFTILFTKTNFKKQHKSVTVKGIFLTDVLTWMASVCSPVRQILTSDGYTVQSSPAMT